MKLTEKEAALEAILFTMGEAVETKRLAEAIGETPEKTRELLEKLRAGWEKEHRGVNLISLEDSWQMCTRSEFYDYLIRNRMDMHFCPRCSVIMILAFHERFNLSKSGFICRCHSLCINRTVKLGIFDYLIR